VGSFLPANADIEADFYGKSLTVKDCTEDRRKPPDNSSVGSIISAFDNELCRKNLSPENNCNTR
jgi:hypothetical protein